jgi:hypothetical protein
MPTGAFPYDLPPQQVGPTFALPVAPPPLTMRTLWMSSRHQQSLAHSFHTMTMVPPVVTDWVADSGASNHTTFNVDKLTSVQPPLPTDPLSIVVGNGSSLPVTSVGNTALPGLFYFNNVLVTLNIIQNLVSVRRFTTDNWCSMEFDPFGLSVKDLSTRNVLTRCNSSGPLYMMRLPSRSALSPCAAPAAALVASVSTWHRRLGHPGVDALSKLSSDSSVICSRCSHDFCQACQLGRHTHMPFVSSTSRADNNFDLIYCDLWTSPVVSVSGYKYYLVILNDCSHFVWTFPLRVKSDTFSILLKFFAFVSTQFGRTIKVVQCDDDREFDNASSRAFFATHGVVLRMSCPYTSPQNGKAERTLRTINNMIRSLLFQASFPARYWVEELHTITYLLNRLPSKMIHAPCPYVALHGVAPSYEHLRVFGCACYPNLSAQAPHKLAPRSTRCVFLGYSADHKGYQCLDLSTINITVSRLVVFNEADFPFAASPRLTNDLDTFLQDDSPGAVPMPAPLPAPHIPLGFLPLAAASGQTSRPGIQTAPGTEAGGPTVSSGGQTTTGT